MYVRLLLCMYACTYVCMCVCVYICRVCMYICMYIYIYVYIYVCMYVRMHVYVSHSSTPCPITFRTKSNIFQKKNCCRIRHYFTLLIKPISRRPLTSTHSMCLTLSVATPKPTHTPTYIFILHTRTNTNTYRYLYLCGPTNPPPLSKWLCHRTMILFHQRVG